VHLLISWVLYRGLMLNWLVCISRSAMLLALRTEMVESIATAAAFLASDAVSARDSTPRLMIPKSGSPVALPVPLTQMPLLFPDPD